MKTTQLNVTDKELNLLIRALRTRIACANDGDALIEFMRLKDQLLKIKLDD